MEAMKPFTKFMMVLKMYTKECLQCISERVSLLENIDLWSDDRLAAHSDAFQASQLPQNCFKESIWGPKVMTFQKTSRRPRCEQSNRV